MMTDCWAQNPADRPEFAEVVLTLRNQRKMTLASIASGDGSNHSGYGGGGGSTISAGSGLIVGGRGLGRISSVYEDERELHDGYEYGDT